nr:GNAT family N-acetyltransferase [Bacillus sp. CECT 9360]
MKLREDIEEYTAQMSDTEYLFPSRKMVQYIGNEQTKDSDGAKKFLDWIYSTYEAGPDMRLMVLVRKEENMPIGHVGLVPQLIDGEEEIEIGYWIVRDYWGKGYATEAAKAIRDHGINQLGKKRLITLIQPGNLASREVGMNCEKEIILTEQEVYVYSNS